MKWLNISVLAGTLALAPLVALAQAPGIPHQFYGTVAYDSGTVTAGLTVRALVGSTIVSTSVTQSNGQYGVNPDLLIVSGPTAGATILFTVNGTPARETAIFANGTLTNLNLTVPGAAPGGTTTTTTSSGSSSGGNPTPTLTDIPPAVTSLTEAQKVYDTNGDDAIDVLDFNALIVHWGETGSAVVADFDGNGVVDVFDFNSLMVHWTA